jgi:hypothetical protein
VVNKPGQADRIYLHAPSPDAMSVLEAKEREYIDIYIQFYDKFIKKY